MLVVEPVGGGHVLLVLAVPARLVAADQQDRRAPRIEGVEHPEWAALVLDPELAQVRAYARAAR